MTVDDFRPCVCGHEKRLHVVTRGYSDCNGCEGTCDGYMPADEPFVDVWCNDNTPTQAWHPLYQTAEQIDSCVGGVRLRIRPSDIAFADWDAKQRGEIR